MKKIIVLFIMLFIIVMAFSQPKINSWDGVCYCIKDYLKNYLKDPKSLEIKSAYGLVDLDDTYIQRVTYRAKNSFGALVLEDKVFFMEKDPNNYGEYRVYDAWDYETFQAYLQMLSK